MLLDQVTGNEEIGRQSDASLSRSPPVFLHCGWRSRGTWIWGRFRAGQEVGAFYEPLSEALASLRSETMASLNAGTWESGHRGLDLPYFEEFRSLLRHGRPGVTGYDSAFATRDFFAPPNAVLPQLERYLRLLLQTAQAQDRQPVLKFCRSLGRIGWMQHRFPQAVHIVVLRNPLTQFESARRQFVLHGQAYFLAMPLLLLSMNRHLPAVRGCLRHLGVDLSGLTGCLSPESRLAACEASVRRGRPDDWYRGFLAFWVLTAAAIPDSVDRIIDSDLLVHSRRYRDECESQLVRLTGQAVHFGDADASNEVGGLAEYRPHRAEILSAHRAAEAFLTDQAGMGWCDKPALARIGRMLAEANLRALTGQAPRSVESDVSVWHDTKLDHEAALRGATRRAARAEEELATVLASRSWKLTGPLRWLRARVPQTIAPVPTTLRRRVVAQAD